MTRIIRRLLAVFAAALVAVAALVLAACTVAGGAQPSAVATAQLPGAPSVGAAASAVPAASQSVQAQPYGPRPDPALLGIASACLLRPSFAAQLAGLPAATLAPKRDAVTGKLGCDYFTPQHTGVLVGLVQVVQMQRMVAVSTLGTAFDSAFTGYYGHWGMAKAHLTGTGTWLVLSVGNPHVKLSQLVTAATRGVQNVMFWWNSLHHSPASASSHLVSDANHYSPTLRAVCTMHGLEFQVRFTNPSNRNAVVFTVTVVFSTGVKYTERQLSVKWPSGWVNGVPLTLKPRESGTVRGGAADTSGYNSPSACRAVAYNNP